MRTVIKPVPHEHKVIVRETKPAPEPVAEQPADQPEAPEGSNPKRKR